MVGLLVLMSVVLVIGCGSKGANQQPANQNANQNGTEKSDVTNENAEKQEFVFLTPKSAPAFPALLMEEDGVDGFTLDIRTWDTLEQLLASLQKNEAHFTAVPLNVGAKLAKQMPLQLINVNTWGTVFLVSTDAEVKNLADLANETIYVSHKSGPPDVLFRFFLANEGLLDKVTLQYATPPEIAQLLIAGKAKHAVVSEPALSAARMQLQGKLHEVIDFQGKWQADFNQDLPQAGIVVNANWAKENPEAVKTFLTAYEAAALEVTNNPDRIAPIVAKAFEMKEPVVKSSLNNMIIKAVNADEARVAVERYFETIMELQPDIIGESLPNEGFYYKP